MSQRKMQPAETGDPADDPRMFRRCLGQFGTGVAVITSRAGGVSAGVTVNSVASVSLDPPLVLWSISRSSRSFAIFQAAEGFAINILAKDQIELSRHFSGSAEEKFKGIESSLGLSGMPLLPGVVAQIECRKEAAHGGGDHVILVGHVTRVSRFDGEPLLFVGGRYVVAADHPDAPVNGVTNLPATPPASAGSALIPLLFEAHHALSAKFEEHRRAEGLSTVPARILAALDGQPAMRLDLVARKTYIGVRDAEDALSDLVAKGQMARLSDGRYALTDAGRERREAIRKRWLDFQSAEMKDIPQVEMGAALDALHKLLANAE